MKLLGLFVVFARVPIRLSEFMPAREVVKGTNSFVLEIRPTKPVRPVKYGLKKTITFAVKMATTAKIPLCSVADMG